MSTRTHLRPRVYPSDPVTWQIVGHGEAGLPRSCDRGKDNGQHTTTTTRKCIRITQYIGPVGAKCMHHVTVPETEIWEGI